MNKKIIVACILLILSMPFLIMLYYPEDSQYIKEYIFLGLCMMLYTIITFTFWIKYGVYLFEPIVLVSVLYLFVFFVDPMVNIVANTTDVMGYDVMDGCIKATTIFFLSYVMLIIGYYGKINTRGLNRLKKIDQDSMRINWTRIETVAFFLWLISFGFGCIEFASKGMSVSYFLTLGMTGAVESEYAESAFGFLGNFRFSMISAWLYLYVCNRKSPKTVLCGILTLFYFILRGFRHSLFVLILSPIIYIFIRKKSSPKIRTIIILFGICVIIMGMMEFVRGSLRSGESVDWESFDTDIFVGAFQGNFDVYKTFYGMVTAVPNQLEFQFGMASIISTITMIIPRRIWSAKPVSPIITNLGMFCGEAAAKAGFAMPNISEYYLDFGGIGCCVIFFILGGILKKMKSLYAKKSYDIHMLVLYSIMLPALLQVILRGYSPSYVFLLCFYALPIIIMKLWRIGNV